MLLQMGVCSLFHEGEFISARWNVRSSINSELYQFKWHKETWGELDLETMATQRKLKYSVSDASRRMYKIETNGIYRKLENPLPSESQLRQQRFEERQRPLSQILASSSFRETLDRNAFSRGQSLSNLKKSRQRNS